MKGKVIAFRVSIILDYWMFQRANCTIAFTSPEYAIVKEMEEHSIYMRKSVVAQNFVCTDSPRCRPNSVIA